MDISRKSYVMMPEHKRAYSNGAVPAGILVAEEKLGRELLPKERVLHINGNFSDNRPENIMVFRTMSDRIRFCNTGLLLSHDDGTYSSPHKEYAICCSVCGKTFIADNISRRVCSDECRSRSHGRKELPPKAELQFFVKQLGTPRAAVLYDVSYSTIWKWCKKLRIKIVEEKPTGPQMPTRTYPPMELYAWNDTQELMFVTIYHAVLYIMNQKLSKAKPDIIKQGIIRMMRGDRKEYLGFKWKSPQYTAERKRRSQVRQDKLDRMAQRKKWLEGSRLYQHMKSQGYI